MKAIMDSEIIQKSPFADMGKYLVLALKSQVIILDLDEQYVCYFEKMVMGILGAIMIWNMQDCFILQPITGFMS